MTRTIMGCSICLVVLLQACTQLAGKPEVEPEAASEPEVSAYAPQLGLSAQQRFREVLNLLEQGDPIAARTELLLYLDEQPRSAVGQDLLRQIDLPGLDYFPADYREIRLASGQSLSSLSKVYLGSVYKFHALAKYNGITEPRKLKVGQKIRIPLTPNAIAAFDAQDNQADDTGAMETPVVMEQVPESAPEPEPELESELASELKTELESEPQPELEPESEPEPVVAAVPDAEKIHRQALNAYRAQDLTRAIALWDQVLATDPDHENAGLYRAQAIELQQKLRRMK